MPVRQGAPSQAGEIQHFKPPGPGARSARQILRGPSHTLAKGAGIRVILAATPPAQFFKWQPALKPAPLIAALNAKLKALAARERIVFVDYGTALATPTGGLKPELTFDGCHPDAAGYAVMAPLARGAVTPALR